jgi:hypothetical protein
MGKSVRACERDKRGSDPAPATTRRGEAGRPPPTATLEQKGRSLGGNYGAPHKLQFARLLISSSSFVLVSPRRAVGDQSCVFCRLSGEGSVLAPRACCCGLCGVRSLCGRTVSYELRCLLSSAVLVRAFLGASTCVWEATMDAAGGRDCTFPGQWGRIDYLDVPPVMAAEQFIAPSPGGQK